MKQSFMKKLVETLIAASAFVLALMMFLTTLDVLLRAIFNSPIPGAFELVEYMMAVLVPFGICYCAFHNSHIAVDLIMDRFSSRVRGVTNTIVTILSLVFVILIAWQNILYFWEVKSFKTTSAVLHIPAFPFVIPTALGFAVFALILTRQVVNCFKEEEQK